MDDGEMRWISEGVPDMQIAVVPRDEITFNDGWYVQGLKGTGSYDYGAEEVFVPHRRTFPLFVREPRRGSSPATRMGLMPVTAAGHASWALGVSKSMLDDVQELAATKFRMSDMASLASRPTFQKGLAHHVAAWRAARLLVLDSFTTAEAAVAAGEDLTPALRADMRAAAVYATDAARSCAEWAHLVAGTTSIREGSRLERAFRDMYTGTQHAFISEKVAIDAAQIWLGIIEDQFGLCRLRADSPRTPRHPRPSRSRDMPRAPCWAAQAAHHCRWCRRERTSRWSWGHTAGRSRSPARRHHA
jgi:alkylation response protein AidB-like acyl-CoA dehydrogenase